MEHTLSNTCTHHIFFSLPFHDSVDPHTHIFLYQLWKSTWRQNLLHSNRQRQNNAHRQKDKGRGRRMMTSHVVFDLLMDSLSSVNTLDLISCKKNCLQQDWPHTAPLCHVVNAFIQSTLLCHDCVFLPLWKEKKDNWTVLCRDTITTELWPAIQVNTDKMCYLKLCQNYF